MKRLQRLREQAKGANQELVSQYQLALRIAEEINYAAEGHNDQLYADMQREYFVLTGGYYVGE